MRCPGYKGRLISLAGALILIIFTAAVFVYVFWVEPPSSPPEDARPVGSFIGNLNK